MSVLLINDNAYKPLPEAYDDAASQYVIQWIDCVVEGVSIDEDDYLHQDNSYNIFYSEMLEELGIAC